MKAYSNATKKLNDFEQEYQHLLLENIYLNEGYENAYKALSKDCKAAYKQLDGARMMLCTIYDVHEVFALMEEISKKVREEVR
jgi:hypothetical protein